MKENVKRCTDKRGQRTRSGAAVYILSKCKYYHSLLFFYEEISNREKASNAVRPNKNVSEDLETIDDKFLRSETWCLLLLQAFFKSFFLSHCNCYTFLTTFFKKYNIQYITRKEKIKYYSTVCIYELEAVGVKLIDCVKIVTNTTPSFPLFLCFSILLFFSAMYFSISCL